MLGPGPPHAHSNPFLVTFYMIGRGDLRNASKGVKLLLVGPLSLPPMLALGANIDSLKPFAPLLAGLVARLLLVSHQ
jgi:hypothetical protein